MSVGWPVEVGIRLAESADQHALATGVVYLATLLAACGVYAYRRLRSEVADSFGGSEGTPHVGDYWRKG